MFLKAIHLDESSYIEFSDRITGEGTKLQMSMRGLRENKAVTIMSAVLEPGDAALMMQILNEWLQIDSKGQ
jgi:hypothetical protein